MGIFSRKPKPSKEFLLTLEMIAKLKAALPMRYRSRTSGPGKLYVQFNVDPRQPDILSIRAGDGPTIIQILFSVGLYGREYLHIGKYVPGNWESLSLNTLEAAKQQYKDFLRSGEPDITDEDLNERTEEIIFKGPAKWPSPEDLLQELQTLSG